MPKIGMRMIKTAIAVFLCFLVYPIVGIGSSPFYSAIAAIICMQPSVADSVKLSLYRTLGTLFGGVAGLLLLLAERSIYPDVPQPVKFLIISLCVIPLIYSTVLIKMPAAASITCVVFLSTTVTHGADANVYLYALGRVIDTLIGIFVSLGVNAAHIPIRKRRDTLYLYDLDGKMSDHEKVAINRLTNLHRAVTVYSLHMPPFLPKAFDELKLRLPVVMMGGAAWYHPAEVRWSNLVCIPSEDTRALRDILSGQGVDSLIYTLVDGILNICYTPSQSPAQRELINAVLHRPCVNLLHMSADFAPEAVCLCALGQPQEIAAAEEAVLKLQTQHRLFVSKRPFALCEGYDLLEIRRADVSIDAAAEDIRKQVQVSRVEYL